MATSNVITFKKLLVRQLPKVAEAHCNTEARYWGRYQVATTLKELSTVTCIHFSPVSPHNYAVTSGARIQVYDSETSQVTRSLSRFDGEAYSGRFRHDGELLVAGSERGVIKVFDNGRSILRQFKHHRKPVCTVSFSTDGLQVFGGSDDFTLSYWNLAEEKLTDTFSGHTDYIRCSSPLPSTNNIYCSGSFDHKLRLWDVRSRECTAVFDHGAPVECILPFPNGTAVITSGGNVVKVWNVIGSSKPLFSFSNHQKTITSLCFDGQTQRLLSAGLDKQVKVYSLQDYSVIYHLSYPAPVLSMAISPNDSHLVVGMTDQLLSIRQRKSDKKMDFLSHAPASRRRYFSRGRREKPTEEEVFISNPKKKKFQPYEKCLRSFEYRKALDAALAHNSNQRNHVVCGVLQELVRRDGLKIALSGRTEEELLPVLQFVVRNIASPQYKGLLVDVSEAILDAYVLQIKADSESEVLLKVLKTKLEVEIRLQRELLEVKGMLETISSLSKSHTKHFEL